MAWLGRFDDFNDFAIGQLTTENNDHVLASSSSTNPSSRPTRNAHNNNTILSLGGKSSDEWSKSNNNWSKLREGGCLPINNLTSEMQSAVSFKRKKPGVLSSRGVGKMQDPKQNSETVKCWVRKPPIT